MGLFSRSGRKNKGKETEIGSPASGEIIDITKVSDQTFAEKILGDGAAVQPSDGRFYAPCDGTLESFYPTGHAYSIEAEDGAQILVHIGIDTVKLKGKYYTVHAEQGQKVKKGDLLVEVDLDGVKSEGYDVVTPVVVMNSEDYTEIRKSSGQAEALQTMLTLVK